MLQTMFLTVSLLSGNDKITLNFDNPKTAFVVVVVVVVVGNS